MSHNQYALLGQRRFLPFFLTQSLGAFNDNVYRQAIIGMLFWLGVSSADKTLYTNLAPALFILPYFLFSALAGQIAEKVEKSTLIRITTAMEIAIMSLAAVGFVTQNLIVLLAALFCTGLQSTLFGPVKYSILPAVLHPRELTGGNGLVEMGTSISILAGMIIGGMVFSTAGDSGPWVAGLLVVTLAVTGHLVSRAIPKAGAGAPELTVRWNPIPESFAVLRLAKKQLAVRNAVLGVSWFWFVGTVLTSQLPTYAEVNLGGSATLYIFALALFSVGTGVGSMLCEKLSARTVEIGLVPLGAFGMTAFMLDLALTRTGAATLTGLDVAGFLQQPGGWRTVVDLLGIGLFTGFFVVPLFALIQSRTPKSEMSRVFAGLNIQNSGFIVLAAVLGLALQLPSFELGGVRVPMPELDIPQVFLALAIANAAVAIWIFTIVPEFLMRFLSWVLVRTLYRLRPGGIHHIPDEGAALVVCNHVSYMDALILAACIPRPVRFVMYYRIFNVPVMRWIFRTAKAIPIAGAREDPALMQRAFDEIDAALAEGEIVCIFPEGALTRDGEISAFKSGVEKILERRPVPVIPMALRGMWTSMWSRRDGRLARMRVPRRFRAQVGVVADAPLDGMQVDAAMLEARVRALRGDAA
ncbi:glycerol acyltransferase [Lysobacter concretionis Ko07 = DSM 16239]|uniref:Glycerol acyltransferase n=1 Tax=Lysobacter concretionis Ko07 = DSM 16239 TaxID=1122185 RepID=A0A0A0EKL4_9GAMM|nr:MULTISPECIES: MFS transporter [Lysobacter]KGM50869.1 glycerol acyltransferase [Lysobacter concretionis Ko07 = DSM 16239]QOD90751.1 MFS transporter [Lysobacter sp. CW239]